MGCLVCPQVVLLCGVSGVSTGGTTLWGVWCVHRWYYSVGCLVCPQVVLLCGVSGVSTGGTTLWGVWCVYRWYYSVGCLVCPQVVLLCGVSGVSTGGTTLWGVWCHKTMRKSLFERLAQYFCTQHACMCFSHTNHL